MNSPLEQNTMEALDVIQNSLKDITDKYCNNDNDDDFSCVRCSGSAGRYVYEKQPDREN